MDGPCVEFCFVTRAGCVMTVSACAVLKLSSSSSQSVVCSGSLWGPWESAGPGRPSESTLPDRSPGMPVRPVLGPHFEERDPERPASLEFPCVAREPCSPVSQHPLAARESLTVSVCVFLKSAINSHVFPFLKNSKTPNCS